ncbi:hypothetical protein BDR03DRAFT_1011922 [Suillus americanus]|nr:hypothetical protein BDR03DRAFT_1011922 [Suillus americanus]
MTIVSDDPTWWPTIDAYRFSSYFVAAASVGIAYDWAFSALTLGQEVELVWRQHWSLITVLYLSVRYIGILHGVLYMLIGVPTISYNQSVHADQCSDHLADRYSESSAHMPTTPLQLTVAPHRNVSRIVYLVWSWTVIVITRLYAMYQRSRKILIFLIVTALAIEIFDGVGAIMMTTTASGEQLILSGTYQCSVGYAEDIVLLGSIGWILSTVWEVLTLCLAAWIAVKHFRGLRQHSTGGIVRDCFTVLIKTHVLYFVSSVAISCFQLIVFLPTFLTDQFSPEIQVYYGVLQIFTVVQTFVLGPRLILGVREFHAKLVADSDAATAMTSIAFQERVHISTGNGV